MNYIGNLQTKEADAKRGRAIAEWLNCEHSDRPTSSAARLIAVLIVGQDELLKRGIAPQKAVLMAFEIGLKGQMLPLEQSYFVISRKEELERILLRRSCVQVKARAEIRRVGPRLRFELVSEDKDSEMLCHFGELINSGNVSRLLRCPNCKKYWYREGRADKRVCSVRCKVALWQKTPEGRAAKAASMRKWRATRKRLWEAKQRGRKLKRGRKVHPSLKKGE